MAKRACLSLSICPPCTGYDTDHPMARGEFGKYGVAISSLADMEVLLDGIPLGEITTSMTINGPAPIIWAMYIVAAEKRGIPRARLAGTIQNDILKEFIAQKEYIFPPTPSVRLVVDTIEFGAREMPLWNTISISGYHIREAGATAVQELAFTLYKTRENQTSLLTIERTLHLVRIPEYASQHGISPHVLRKLALAGKLPTVRAVDDGNYYLPANLELPPRACKQCGTSLDGYACNRTYCDTCRVDLKRERHRDWIAARRQLRAVPLVG